MTTGQKSIKTLIDALESDIQAQEAGDFTAIAMRSDAVQAEFSPTDPKGDVVEMAFKFWDCWGDASNHDWRHYDGIESYEWPYLAREVVAALRENEMPSNEVIIRYFTPQPHVPMLQRIKIFFGITKSGKA